MWVSLPPFVGPMVNVDRLTELVDHPLPALITFAVVVVLTLWHGASDDAWFAGGLVIVLAGLFVTGTHVPLVGQALGGGVSWPATLHHSLPGTAVLITGVVWAWTER